MRSDTPLDYAVFQLSPKCSRCELFVSGDGNTEKLASGLLKPFVTHLTVAKEQVARAVRSIKLEVEERKNEGTWFTKGTLERFVRFVSTPEVLELVITFDAEMSQLEAARRIYLQGTGNQLSSALGGDEAGAAAAADISKQELLRAIDVRLVAVRQDLTTACARASAAGFSIDTVTELQLFADHFGAHRLNEACTKFISLSQRRPDLIKPWKSNEDDRAIRSSSESDMSIDDTTEENIPVRPSGPHQSQFDYHHQKNQLQASREQEQGASQHTEQLKPSPCLQSKASITFPMQRSLGESSSDRDASRESDGAIEKNGENVTESPHTSQPVRRLSVQDRINLFENKQKEQSQSGGSKVAVGKSVELRRLSSDVSLAGQAMEKAVLRRWSGASDMSVDLSSERKETESSASTPCSTSNYQAQSSMFPSVSEDKDIGGLKDMATSSKVEFTGLPGELEESVLKDRSVSQTRVGGFSGREEPFRSKDPTFSETHSRDSSGRSEGVGWKDRTDSETQLRAFSGKSEGIDLKDQPASQHQLKAFSGRAEDVGCKDQVSSTIQNQSKISSGRADDLDVKVQAASQSQFRSFPCGPEQVGLKDQAALFRFSSVGTSFAGVKDQVVSQGRSQALLGRAEDVGPNDWTASDTHLKASVGKAVDVGSSDEPFPVPFKGFPSRVENVRLRDQRVNQAPFRASPTTAADVGLDSKDQLVSQPQFTALPGKFEDETGTKDLSVSRAQYRGFEGDLSVSQSKWSSSQGKIEELGKKESMFSHKQVESSSTREEDSGLQGTKLQRQSSALQQSNQFPGGRGTINPIYGNGEQVFTQRKVIENPEIDSTTTAPIEQIQKIRLSKGNQELNNELQIKANELEKLFAAHKLRVPGDQSGAARRCKPSELQVEQVASAVYGKPVEVTPVQLHEKTLMRVVDNPDYGNTMRKNIVDLGFSEDSKGKFYDKYMQKRDAKLREEWSSTRAQKEAKMKAMQDNLERSRAEMKATFAGSAERQGSALYAHRHAEKLRSFNIRSATKNIEQQPIESVQIEEDEDLSEISEQTQYGQEGSLGETFLGDGSSRGIQSKRLLPNKSLSSSTPRTSSAPNPRLSVKPSNFSSGRRRTQPENPLAQSVPNFSDFRKENTKPSSGISKATSRSNFRSYVRSKSISEELPLVKEDKPRRSHSMRKSSAGPGELRDLSPPNSDGDILTTSKFDKEQPDHGLYNKIPRNGDSRPFLRKGNGIGPGAGVGVAKLKASMAYENLKTEEESDELVDQLEESVDVVKEAEEEDSDPVMVEDELKAVDYPADSDDEKQGISKESEKSGDPESENGDVLKSVCQLDPDSVDEVVAAVPSMFHSSGPVQDSPGESPASWNSRGHQLFSYTQEPSDIDAFVDSPMGSPASWNSHSLVQMEADAARMRKKWGSAQKPILVANTSQHQTRKDVTKGFKRLLKFGRKSRGTESLVDWISATTSEGDDDTEDGRDLANRSSEDLRKSRMGFSQDGYNDGELFNEQVQVLGSSIPAAPANFRLREDHISGSSLKAPRSFFSLSSFRSKGSESKPR